MVREALGMTCAAAGIDTSRVYEYFLLFLLVRCNRLRLDENWRPDQLRNREAVTRLAIENRERFVL
jgi:hypothetical protein